MLTGHVAVAMGAHGLRRSIPLWLLLIAAQLPDWTDAVLCAGGIRPAMPGMYSHSLAATATLALIAAAAAALVTRESMAGAIAGTVVILHTAGDYVTGIKPTWPGGPTIGLDLYSFPALDFLFEAAVLTMGWMLYRLSFPPEKRSSKRILFVLAALLAAQAASDIVLALSPGLKKC